MADRDPRDIDEFLEAGASPILESEAESLGAGAPVGPTPSFEGQRFGPWELVEEIGHGGMSVVYRARRADGQFEQDVAIKVMRQPGRHPELARRFRVEQQILAGLAHPHIARILDGGVSADGWPWIAMEHVDGQPLDEYLRGRRRSEVLELFGQVCDAVHHAHQHLVVHRDLKPSNILVDRAGTVKLLDFGIAKLLDRSTISTPHTAPLTSTGMRVLTPEYAAPEQVRGQAVTTRTDVYALGVILYQLVAGRRPYEVAGAGATELERIVCEHDPPPPATGNGELDTICMKALRKEPDERYATARELHEDLERLAAGQPVRARPTTVGYRLRKFVRRNRLGVASGAAIVLLSVGFGVAMGLQARATAEARDAARLEAQRAGEVTEFLLGVFEAGNPKVAGVDTLGARDLLEVGLERVDELGGQPDLQLSMLDVMGRAFFALGQYDRAVEIQERATALHRGLVDPDPALGAALDRRLALSLEKDGQRERAVALMESSLQEHLRLFGPEHPEPAKVMAELGEQLVQVGQIARADSLFSVSVRILEREYGAQDPFTLTSLNNWSVMLAEDGQYERSVALQETVLARRTRLLGPRHLEVANSLNNLAVSSRRLGHNERAAQLYRESIDIKREVYGGAHPDIALSLANLGIALGVQGKYAQSEQAMLESLHMREELLGPGHPRLSNNYANLAMLMERWGKPERAVEYGERSLEIARNSGEPLTAAELVQLGNLSLAHSATGNYRAALEVAEEAIRLANEIFPEDHPRRSSPLSALAQAQAGLGQLGEAEATAREVLELVTQSNGERHRVVAIAAQSLGEILRQRGKLEEATTYTRQALETRRELGGDEHPRTADALHEWGLLCLAKGEREAAREAFEEALAIRLDSLGEEASATQETREQLAALGGP